MKTTGFKNKSIQLKANLLNYLTPTAKLFKESGKKDDRQLFLNMLKMLFEFLEVADTVYGQNTTMDCSINHTFQEEYNTLLKIQENFKGKELK